MLSETIRQAPATPAFIDVSRVVQRKTESLAFMAILKKMLVRKFGFIFNEVFDRRLS